MACNTLNLPHVSKSGMKWGRVLQALQGLGVFYLKQTFQKIIPTGLHACTFTLGLNSW